MCCVRVCSCLLAPGPAKHTAGTHRRDPYYFIVPAGHLQNPMNTKTSPLRHRSGRGSGRFVASPVHQAQKKYNKIIIKSFLINTPAQRARRASQRNVGVICTAHKSACRRAGRRRDAGPRIKSVPPTICLRLPADANVDDRPPPSSGWLLLSFLFFSVSFRCCVRTLFCSVFRSAHVLFSR